MSGCGEYGDYVCEVDWCVGEVMAALDRKGMTDNTLLIFASDNGPENSAYGHIQEHGHYSMAHLRGIKRDAWEGGHRVPHIARWPGVTTEGSECDQLTSHLDLMATCADFLGVALPEEAGEDSVSQMPLLRGERSPRPFAVHHSASGKFAVRRGEWVFIDAPSGDDNREPQWFKDERGYTDHDFPGELYNLGEDIAERSNLYGDYPEVVSELSALLVRVKEGSGDDPSSTESERALSE
jgi:arylsulfatase A-like enzyme